jgi:hypothetical protein
MDGDDDAAPAPPPLLQQPPSQFDLQLASLERNEPISFDLCSTVVAGNKLTAPEARTLADALKRSTSVTSFLAYLHTSCSVQSIRFFVEYIRTSSRLEEVTVMYCRDQQTDPKEIALRYEGHVDSTFHAVMENPSIHKLTVLSTGNNPDVMYHLLANTTSLKDFKVGIARAAMKEEMATSIAAGFSNNRTLSRVELGARYGPLETILPGLAGCSSLESLVLNYYDTYSASFWGSVSKLTRFSASLRDLTIEAYNGPVVGESVDKVFSDLRHPACASLKKLHLKHVTVGETTISRRVPIKQNCNARLQVLRLESILLESASAIHTLWNVVGLHKKSSLIPPHIMKAKMPIMNPPLQTGLRLFGETRT